MLHILLFLLKIIGIVLVSLLGLLLFLLIIVLFVPIRYKLDATVKGVIKGEAKVTWLLRAVSFRATYVEEQLRMKLKIFGRIFYDNQEPGRGKRRKKPKKASGKGRRRKDKNKDVKPTDNVPEGFNDETIRKQELEERPSIGQNAEAKENAEEPDSQENKTLLAKENEFPKEVWEETDKNAEWHQTEKLEADKSTVDEETPVSQNEPEKDDPTFFEKILQKAANKIKAFIQKIKALFKKVMNIGKSIKDGVFHIREKWDKIKAFYYDEINKAGILSTLKSFTKILKHIHPKRLDVEFEFGTGDPCLTGQLLGVLAIFFAYYGDSVKVIPNFEDAVFEGKVFCYGRIRLFTLLIICIKLKLNDNFNQLIKNFKRLKEDL